MEISRRRWPRRDPGHRIETSSDEPAPLSLAEGEASHPAHEHDRRDDPEQVDREAKPGEQQHQEQDEDDESDPGRLRPPPAAQGADSARARQLMVSWNWARTGFSIAKA
jgi:hypothetical protein